MNSKNLNWSVYFQNPDFLEYSRIGIYIPEFEPLIIKWCGVTDKSRVLDVGCGTGFSTRLLKRGGTQIEVVGIDAEKYFIIRAREEARQYSIITRCI